MIFLLGCAPEPALNDEIIYPHPDQLPEAVDPPDPFVRWSDGTAVTTVAEWDARRDELLTLFRYYEYGHEPALAETTVVATSNPSGTSRELSVEFEGGAFRLLLLLPEGEGPFPVLLGQNACGNSAVAADLPLEPPSGWVDADHCEGGQDPYWPTAEALSRGVAVATFHQSDIQPDDPEGTGVEQSLSVDAESDVAWGTIAAWSYGVSLATSVLLDQPDIEPDGIYVWGHSRRGKVALWSAALDTRIAGAWAHQSGTGGAALARTLGGESIAAINLLFPHWFNEWFPLFGGRETYFPTDQHLLIATIAPRPVLCSDGEDDAWADPAGAEQAVALATPVFDFLDAPAPQHTLRDGAHEVRAEDWAAAVEDWLLP